MFRVVTQTLDECLGLHLFSADLVDGSEHREPERKERVVRITFFRVFTVFGNNCFCLNQMYTLGDIEKGIRQQIIESGISNVIHVYQVFFWSLVEAVTPFIFEW